MIAEYKDEKWFKYLQYKWPEQAEFINDAYVNIQNKQAYNACASIRTLLEFNIQYIGEVKNKKGLEVRDDVSLHNRIKIIEREKIVPDKEIVNLMYNIKNKGNRLLHQGKRDLAAIKIAESAMSEMQSYLIWFVDEYGNLDEFKEFDEIDEFDETEIYDEKDKDTIIIKYCPNKKQCGRKYEATYQYDVCLKCGASIEQIEEKVNTNEIDNDIVKNDNTYIKRELSHYIQIGYNNNGNYEFKDRIKLDNDNITLGRISYSYNYKPDIDLSKYIDDEEYYTEISRKHALIYKKDDLFYIENLSEEDDIVFVNENTDDESIIKRTESKQLNESEIISLGNNLIFINYIVE